MQRLCRGGISVPKRVRCKPPPPSGRCFCGWGLTGLGVRWGLTVLGAGFVLHQLSCIGRCMSLVLLGYEAGTLLLGWLWAEP